MTVYVTEWYATSEVYFPGVRRKPSQIWDIFCYCHYNPPSQTIVKGMNPFGIVWATGDTMLIKQEYPAMWFIIVAEVWCDGTFLAPIVIQVYKNEVLERYIMRSMKICCDRTKHLTLLFVPLTKTIIDWWMELRLVNIKWSWCLVHTERTASNFDDHIILSKASQPKLEIG